ncbi:MAG: 50S ribosomal protein L21e [Candidatus Diapherotrites archaeon]
MVNKKPIRTRGKLKLSRYFQNFKEGDFVSIIREISLHPAFPKRLQGRTGIVKKRVGKSYVIELRDQKKKKEFLIKAIHLKKIKT